MPEPSNSPPLPRPEKWIKAMRSTDDGVEQLGFVGYIDTAVPQGDKLHVSVKGPEGLLERRPLPFDPPMREVGSNPDAFDFHWRSLDYVFSLPDPRQFPPLATSLEADQQAKIDRYVRTARDLAASGVLNAADAGIAVRIEDETDIEHVTVVLTDRDREIGFAALLRHCDAKDEVASFDRVRSLLWVASQKDADEHQEQRLEILKGWQRAAGQLHARSLNQLLRNKLVSDEGMGVLAYEEESSPTSLLSAFDYGDLLHWGRKRDVVAQWEADEYTGAERRLAFLAAAAALAHVYIGFAVLAETATSAPTP